MLIAFFIVQFEIHETSKVMTPSQVILWIRAILLNCYHLFLQDAGRLSDPQINVHKDRPIHSSTKPPSGHDWRLVDCVSWFCAVWLKFESEQEKRLKFECMIFYVALHCAVWNTMDFLRKEERVECETWDLDLNLESGNLKMATTSTINHQDIHHQVRIAITALLVLTHLLQVFVGSLEELMKWTVCMQPDVGMGFKCAILA